MNRKFGLSFLVVVGSIALSAACGGPSTGEPTVGLGDAGPTPSNVDTRPSDVSVAEAPIDFGLADCGGAAPAEKTIKITNAGGGTVTWTAELESEGFSIIGATTGAFSGSGSVKVTVKAKPVLASAVAGAESRATLVIVIDRTKIFRIPLRVTAQGATLEVAPGEAVFGDMPINVQAPDLALAVKNIGNKAVSVRIADPNLTDFKIAYSGAPEAVTVAPGATLVGAAARFRPSKLTLQTTSAPITVTGAICGKSATAVTMSGKGTGGVVGISPGQLDFLKVNCGAKANAQVFTILNSGNAPFTWTAALADGPSSFFEISPLGGTVLAGSQTQVFVTPKDIPQTSAITDNLYGDTLTVTTNAANDTPHAVPLLMGARGAILAFSATPADYGTRDLFSATIGKTASIANTGNAPATVTVSSSTTAYTPNPAAATVINAAAGLDVTVNFAPTVFGDNNANLSVTSGSVLCQPLPAAISLTGKGKGVASSIGVGSTGRSTERSSSACAVLTGAPGNVGHVACWGDNQFGQLGQGSALPNQSPTPLVIPNFSGAVAVAGTGEYNCARMTNGTVYCWGRNTNSRTPPRITGQLGSAGADKPTPTLVAGLTNVISLSAAERHTCAVSTTNAGDTSGKIFCWGTNKRGNLGTGTISDSSSTPLQVSGITDALTVSTSGFGGCARRVGNVVSCWGVNNAKGNLGNGVTTGNPTGAPVTVTGLSTAVFLASGGSGGRSGISCAAEITTGNVVCWGDNNGRPLPTIGKINGVALTNSFSNPLPSPVTVPGVSGATAVTAGRQHMCAVVANGAVKCWGRGPNGQLGNGTNVAASTQVDVTGLLGVKELSSSRDFNCALLTAGSVMCWGQSTFGQLGNPAAASPQNTPILVSGF